MASSVCWNCEHDAHQTFLGAPIRQSGPVGEKDYWFGFYKCDYCGCQHRR